MAQLTYRNKVWNIPESNFECNSWQVYYQDLKSSFGKNNARMIWLATWQLEKSPSCLANTAFNDWQKKAGLDVGNAGFDLLSGAAEMANGIFGLPGTVSRVLNYGIPIAIGGIVVVFLIAALRPNSLPGAALNHFPPVRAMNLAKNLV